MSTFQRILVPVDFSEGSWAALSMAAEMSRRTRGRLELIHVWQPPSFLPPESVVGTVGLPSQPLLDVVRGHAEAAMRELLERARTHGIEVSDASVVIGEPARTIVDRAADEGYDLIVLGTHGRTGISHLLLGSVAEKVVRLSPVPVLTVQTSGAV